MPHPWSDLAAPFLFHTLLWTAGSALAGALLAAVSFAWIRRAGGYRLDSPHARAWQIGTLLLMLLALPTLAGGIGLLEGLHRGAGRALRGERLAREVYPWVGQLGADAVGAAYFAYRGALAGEVDLEVDLEAFRSGLRPIDAVDLHTALGRLGPGAVDEAVELTRRKAGEWYPPLSRGIGAALSRFVLDRVGGALRAWAAGRIGKLGLPAPAPWLQAAVRSAASRDGDPAGLSHDELAAQLVDDALVRPALAAARLYARGHQALLAPWIPPVLGGPVVLFWIARALSRRRQDPA
jgi:hypothetical protein